MDGVCCYFYNNGTKRYEVEYKRGSLDGYYKEWNSSGVLIVEADFKDGRYDGYVREFFDNGYKRYESKFKMGEFDGIYREYFYNGSLKNEYYKKDYLNLETLKKFNITGIMNNHIILLGDLKYEKIFDKDGNVISYSLN